MDTSGCFGSRVAADPAGERELLEETLHSRQIFAHRRVDFRICSFQVGVGQNSRRSVTRSREENRIQVILVDQPVEVDVGEGLAGVRAPMTQQSSLDMLSLQRLAQQRVFLKVE